MDNKYLIYDSDKLTERQLTFAKANSFYLFHAMAKLRSSVRKGDKIIGGVLHSPMIGGKLQYDDIYTGLNTNDLGGKIKFLVEALSDEKHPENLEMFKKSFFYTVFLKKIVTGAYYDNDLVNWPMYKNVSNDENIKKRSAFGFAMEVMKDDMSLPLGVDFSKVIDIIVQTDKNGNYYLEENCSNEDKLAIAEAVNLFFSILQNHPRFGMHFINPEEYYD